MSRPRVLLADDHRIVSEGLKGLLADDFELVGMVEDGRALIAAARTLKPDVVVADISMPHVNGIDAVAQLKKDNPDIKVVFLTMHQDSAYARRALDAGAHGFVVKHSATAELVMAIHAALKGQTFITPALTGDLLRQGNKSSNIDDAAKLLTARQLEILRLLAEGRSAKEIAISLAISPRTVEFHKYQLMEAHGLHSNAELIHFAIKHGVVTI
ncbi:response regulator [Taklimakanibacter deserti]|uniref:response regulator n=1 Tax=Taklimakanibacter deserti TaxID=2267839 RepID=UPI000E650D43